MDRGEAASSIREWLQSEMMEARDVEDQQATIHLHVRYPPTKRGHLFNIVIPKNRDLVLIYSVTRVDEGQQNEMTTLSNNEPQQWKDWLHETRLDLTRADLDWVLHVGGKAEGITGPLQAFNLSRPIWLDGLSQNEFMHTMRRVWLSKLSLIHRIKHHFGTGSGKPGPVDDWAKKKSRNGPRSKKTTSKPRPVDIDETGGFGRDFDPADWA
ncbi:MAG: DUF2299 family protein [Candidatus Thalassarchaeaceae archaeon]|nr:DUF2299 family protein [Candidatus Thalassarchaeaceae archaeon]